MKRYLYLLLMLLASVSKSNAQLKILTGKISAGMTTESTEGIMLETSSGDIAFTQTSGHFSIKFQPKDTLSFYISGKLARRFLIDSLSKIPHLVLSLQSVKNAPIHTGKITYLPKNEDTTTLNNVTVTARNYRADSLALRNEYKEAFNYTKPKLKFGEDWTPFDVNIGKLAEVLNFKKKKRHQMLKKNLLREEQEDYVDYRFNKTFVQKYLDKKITEENLNDFMRKYRPKYEDLVLFSDLDLMNYIRKSYKQYQEKI